MKKILLSIVALFTLVVLAGCMTTGTTISFTSFPDAVYEAGDYTDAQIKDFKSEIKVSVSGTEYDLNSSLLTVNGFDATTLKNAGSYTLVVSYQSVSVSYNYTVVGATTVVATPVATAAELTAALANGGVIELTADIESNKKFDITKSVTIKGNGKKISVPSSATRVFNIDGVSNINVNLVDLNLTSNGGQRCISLYNTSNVTLVIDHCTLEAGSYTLNLASFNTGCSVTVKNNSKITGWAAINIWSNSSEINVMDSELVGNGYSVYAESNDFGVIVLNGGGNDYEGIGLSAGDTGQNNKLTFKNCNIKANKVEGGNIEWLLLVQLGCVGNTVDFNGCKLNYAEGNFYCPDDLKPAANTVTVDGVRK